MGTGSIVVAVGHRLRADASSADMLRLQEKFNITRADLLRQSKMERADGDTNLPGDSLMELGAMFWAVQAAVTDLHYIFCGATSVPLSRPERACFAP